MGAGISEGTHKPCRRTQGGGRALWACGPLVHLPEVFSVPKILKYSRKIILNFQGIWRTFIFWSFFIAQEIQKTIK